jgi:hypothetical protein
LSGTGINGTTQKGTDGPLFVVGVPRSGTSLLHVLLNQHPRIALMFEADLPLLWPLFLIRTRKLKWLERWNFWNMCVERHHIDITRIPENVADVATGTEAAYQEYMQHKSATIWGDKTPDQYGSLCHLADHFPNARFIIIWRDPADVCRSMIRARTKSLRFQQKGLTHRALMGCQELGVERDRLLQRGFRVHEIHFEDLVRDTPKLMREICGFLEIPFDPRMATLHDADTSAIHPAEHNRLVKGEQIVASRKYDEVLPVRLKNKIERYKNLWKLTESHLAAFPPSGENHKRPSFAERLCDQLRYRCLKFWDLFVVFAYSFLPLNLLRLYRSARGHVYLNSTWDAYVQNCILTRKRGEEPARFTLEHAAVGVAEESEAVKLSASS